MTDDVTPEGQVALEDDSPDAAPAEVEKPQPLYAEQLSKFAMSLFPTGSPIFLVNAADGSLFYDSHHDQRFGAESAYEVFETPNTAFTRVTGDWARLIPMLKRVRFTLTPFHLLLDESTPELRALSREFLDSFPLTSSMREHQKQIVVMQPTSAAIEVRFNDASGAEWIACSAITATNGDNARTFVTYRHAKAFDLTSSNPPMLPNQVPAAQVDLATQIDLIPALLATHLATFKLSAVTADASASYDKPKAQGERIIATHREFGARYIKEAKDFSFQLYGKTKIGIKLTKWEQFAIEADAQTHVIDNLRDQDVGYFSSNAGDWIVVDLLVREGVLTIDPKLIPLIERALDLAYIVTTPTLPLPIAMRLGWLTDEPKIECRLDDPEKGFTAGYFYSVSSNSQEGWEQRTVEEEDPKTGRVIAKRKRRPKKWQQFRVVNDHDRVVPFDDNLVEDILYLAEHFVIRDPGHQATRFPPRTFEMLRYVDEVEKEFLIPRGERLETFQKYDLAVGLAKKDYVLSHEMGLGKTLQLLTYIVVCVKKLGATPAGLVVTRKDLIPQWCAEAKKFYGMELKVLDGTAPTNLSGTDRRQWQLQQYGRVRALKRRIKAGLETGIWITSYYDLAQTMKRASDETDPFLHSPYRSYDQGTKQDEWVWRGSLHNCPDCQGSNEFKLVSVCPNRRHRDGGGKFALSRTRCGWTHHEIRLKTYGSLLSTAFRKGVIVLDEATEISNESQQGQSVCGLRAAFRCAATGTPVKNYIGQAFNILGWTLGFTSTKKSAKKRRDQQDGVLDTKPIRFPYPYGVNGRTAFEEKYAVFEQHLNKDGAWTGKKPVAATLQNSRLWRELAPAIVARRKEETGVRLPPKKFHTLQVPLGVYQREQMNTWRIKYPEWKAQEDAKNGVERSGIHTGSRYGFNSLLGLEAKLNWSCVLPCGDDDHEWTEVPVSDWTPMMFKSIETTMKLVASGRKVVVGSDTPKAVEFISEALEARGVKTVCLSKGGAAVSPKERPELILEFQNGDAKVLCASMRSIEMGHNIDAASAMVVHGLTWDYKTFHQFENRIHRWSSKRPVDIFIVLPGEENHTLVGRKWGVLKDKTAGIAKALHGEFDLIEDEKPDQDAILQDLIKHGIPTTGEEVKENEVRAGFERMPHISAFERDLTFEATLATWEDGEVLEDGEPIFNPKAYVNDKPEHAFITHGEIADSLEAFFRAWTLAEAREQQERDSRFYQLLVQLQQHFQPIEDVTIDTLVLQWLGISWQTSLESALAMIEDHLREAGVDLSTLDPEPEPEPVVEPEPEPIVEPTPEPPTAVTPEPVEEPAPTPTMTVDLVGQIKGLKELLDEGIIDEDEFKSMKAALITSLASREEVAA